jgi:hypothetical protein
MFSSRIVDGKWRLAVARGRLIRGDHRVKEGEITFSNQKKAKACVDELNDKTFYVYNCYVDRDNNVIATPPSTLVSTMADIIKKYAE